MEAVRRATQADSQALAKMLARAFDDDPVAEWVCPHRGTRARMLQRFQAARLRHMLPHGEVWMTADGSAAAIWAPPLKGKTTTRHELEMFAAVTKPRILPRLPRIQRGMDMMEKAHPQEPHYYLAVVGTEPAMQGRGLGTATLEPVLAQCDQDGIGAYLESSKERNVDYYARFGFRVTEALHLPKGPDMWLMWREPRR